MSSKSRIPDCAFYWRGHGGRPVWKLMFHGNVTDEEYPSRSAALTAMKAMELKHEVELTLDAALLDFGKTDEDKGVLN